MTLLPATSGLLLGITREGRAIPAALAISGAPAGQLTVERGTFLHRSEEAAWSVAGVAKRQHDYLRGRYAAKVALQTLRPELAPRDTPVEMGVFGQPVVRAPQHSNLRVSIAHSGAWAAALAFDEGHPMAVDLEVPDAANAAVIAQECTPDERAALAAAGFGEPLALTMLWSVKEALGKCLGTGLMTPLALYAVSTVERNGEAAVCDHRNFAQYHTVCVPTGRFVLAITLPRKSMLACDGLSAVLTNQAVG